MEKKVKLSLFVVNIIYVENPREASKKFNKVSGYKINIKKPIVFSTY